MKQKNETFIYTTPSVGMVVNVGLQEHLWMVTNRQPRQCFSIMAVTFTAVLPTVSKTTPVSYSRILNSRMRKLRMQAKTWPLSGNVKLLATKI